MDGGKFRKLASSCFEGRLDKLKENWARCKDTHKNSEECRLREIRMLHAGESRHRVAAKSPKGNRRLDLQSGRERIVPAGGKR